MIYEDSKLKRSTVNGLFWSLFDNLLNQGVQFLIGILLARLLSPREFGLIGMMTIFVSISQLFIDSGFSNALIRKKDCTIEDYSTTFYFNIAVALIFYIIIFFSSEPISIFFNEPDLKHLLRVLGLGLILNAFSLIQRTILSKKIDFKLQTKVSFIASLASGVIAVLMALTGYGVWSLIALTLVRYFTSSVLLWVYTKWYPILVFSKDSFTEMFSFGSKLLLSSLLDTGYRNISTIIIGKFFKAEQLGFYTTADQFQTLPSQNLQSIISRVSYPVLSKISEDKIRLRSAYVRLIKSTMLISFFMMICLAASAKPLIIILLGEKWIQSAEYLQLLCFVGAMYPLHALNLNILQVSGRSDLFLKLEFIKKGLGIPVIIAGIFLGIKVMIIGMILNSIVSLYINSFWSGKMIDYSFSEQLKDIFPSFLLAIIINGIVFTAVSMLDNYGIYRLLLQIGLSITLAFITLEIWKMEDYLFIKNEFFDLLKNIGKYEKTG